MEVREKIQHLRGTTPLTIDKAKELGMLPGEIAVKNGDKGASELYVLSEDGESLDVFVSKSYIDSKMFCGTKEEYDEAYAAGKIATGALVIITNDKKGDEKQPILGQGVLGQMILN